MSAISKRLTELGVALPAPAAAIAAYVPYTMTGNLVFISGQLPLEGGRLIYTGRVGIDLDLATAQYAARLCAINILAQLNQACGGDLDRVQQCVKLGGFVASAPEFFDHPKVINGASEFIQDVFGAAGKHARFAVGVSNLPLNAAVEVDAVFSLKA